MNPEELKQRVAALPPLDKEIIEDWTWPAHCYHLREHLKRGDPVEDFVHWSTVTGTIYVGNGGAFTDYERAAIKGRFADDLYVESPVGGPDLIPGTLTSAHLTHQLYTLLQLEDKIGPVEKLKSIFEFGAGYGAFPRLLRLKGFAGRYYLYDFPEWSLLQQYYLSNTVGIDNMVFLTKTVRPVKVDLFFAAYSLSETPLPVRNEIMRTVQAKQRFVVFQAHYMNPSHLIYGTNNVDWFREQGFEVWPNVALNSTINPGLDQHWYGYREG